MSETSAEALAASQGLASPSPSSPAPPPSPGLAPEQLTRLRTAHRDAGVPSLSGPRALSLVAQALAGGSDLSLAFALYEALMQGFDEQQLVDRVTPVLVAYVGVDAAPRLHQALRKLTGMLATSASASPTEIERALQRAFAPKRFQPEPVRAVLSDAALATLRASYRDDVFKTMGARAVKGSSQTMDGFTTFLDSTVYDPASLDAKLREAMILTVMASKADAFGTAVHCYAGLGVGLEPAELRDILGSIGDEPRAALATAVLEATLAVLAGAIERHATDMLVLVPELRLRFAS